MKTTMKTLLCTAIISVGAVSASASTRHLGILIPPDFKDWHSDIPMISMDGGETGIALTPDTQHCGWYYADLENISDDVVIYRKGDGEREDLIGLNGNWESGATATPIPLATLFAAYDSESLYFVSDMEQFLSDDDSGWYLEFPEGVDGVCQFNWPMVIYDTDASLHPSFSCYSAGGEGCQKGVGDISVSTAVTSINNCIGITTGIVEDTLDTSVGQFKRKPKLTKKGEKCFINETVFNQLFAPTEGVNEASCSDISLVRTENFKWMYNSDLSQSKGAPVPGGFFPVEESTDEIIKSNLQTPLPAARTKRAAEGPIFYGPELRAINETTGHPRINTVCNGPGWSKGVDCEGSFAEGDGTELTVQSLYPQALCVLGWSCPDQAPEGWNFFKSGSEKIVNGSGEPRWTGERNQHFCTESHITFTYKKGQTFSVLGDDDIWVYIDNKLAIDLGGTHLAAPGFVDLDQFAGVSGKLVEGNSYNLDMFTCDRRTTMSNLTIQTEILPDIPSPTINVTEKRDAETGIVLYKDICYIDAPRDCADMIAGKDVQTCTTPDMNEIKYVLTGFEEPKELEKGKVNYGGIDLTDVTNPKIEKDKMVGLPAGKYTLYAVIFGTTKKLATFAAGTESIGNKPVVAGNVKVFSAASNIAIHAQGAKKFAVMDMMGRVLKSGNLANGQASIHMDSKGSFLVRVGSETKLVNVK